jgi:hypothetical protein
MTERGLYDTLNFINECRRNIRNLLAYLEEQELTCRRQIERKERQKNDARDYTGTTGNGKDNGALGHRGE